MASRETKAIWHPVRAHILELIIRGPATLSQIAQTVGKSVETVAYHSRVLCGAGCIQAVEVADPRSAEPLFEICA